MTVDEREAFIQQLAVELSGAVPTSPLSHLMFNALERAGWVQSFSLAEAIQLKGGNGRAGKCGKIRTSDASSFRYSLRGFQDPIALPAQKSRYGLR